ncbi:MAG: hypothetical protein NTZ68_01765 [Candidatus Dependentiae bacterium]|nr:hypothetical protein [Candidatus Dependentiae bacterium]
MKLLPFFLISCFFQIHACEHSALSEDQLIEKSIFKNVDLYAQMYQLSEQEAFKKLSVCFPFFPERIDVKLNVAAQAGNSSEVKKILEDAPGLAIQTLRTAILFARQDCYYPGSKEFLPVGSQDVVVSILCQRLLSYMSDVENNIF